MSLEEVGQTRRELGREIKTLLEGPQTRFPGKHIAVEDTESLWFSGPG